MDTESLMKNLESVQMMLKRYSVPIVTVLDTKELRHDDDMPDPVIVYGSGFVLRIGGRDFLFSAKHVLEDACTKFTPLYYPGKDSAFEQLVYGSELFHTNDPDDKIDVAFVEIRPGSLGSPFSPIVLSNAMICHPADVPFMDKIVSVIGFPRSENPVSFAEIKFKALCFAGKSSQHMCDVIGRNKALSVVFKWDINNVGSYYGERIVMADQPAGCSGAPVWLVCNGERIQEGVINKLIGMFVYHDHKLMLGVASRIEVAVEMLRKKYPELMSGIVKTHINATD